MNSGEQNFDLVIAGGGMTGAMLAQVLLAQYPNLQLAIVEQTPFEPSAGAATSSLAPANSFDRRSIALAAGSVELLQQWGLWPELAAHACAIQQIQVSDRGHFGKTYLDAAAFNRSSLGQVLEIEWLGALLYPKLDKFRAQGRLHWFRPDRIVSLQPGIDQQQLQLASGLTLQARLLIICEGGDSPTRQLAGMSLSEHPYGQTALIANIGISEVHQHVAFERFTQDGPIALLPLTQQRYSLVWTLTPAAAEVLQQLPETQFLEALQQAFGYRAGVFTQVGQRQLYPLTLKYSAEAAKHRVLLCGNSLHNLHPIAGQGFNLALRDIAAISSLIGAQAAAVQTNPTIQSDIGAVDPGSYAISRGYQQLRQADVQQVILFTDALVRLFSNQSRLIALWRNLGLTALMHCPELKNIFARQSMGLSPILRQKQQLEAWFSAGSATTTTKAAR